MYISLLPTTCKIVFSIFLTVFIPYVEEITGEDQCGVRRHTSNADQIFSIRQTLEKNGSIMGQHISYLQILRRPMTQLERITVQYSHCIRYTSESS
jgi:hypothetical protein